MSGPATVSSRTSYVPLLIALSVTLTYCLFSFGVFAFTDAWFFQNRKGYKIPLVLTISYILWFALELCIPSNPDGTFFNALQYDKLTWSPPLFMASIIAEVFIAMVLHYALASKFKDAAQFWFILTSWICAVILTPIGCVFAVALTCPDLAISGKATFVVGLASLLLSLLMSLLFYSDAVTISRTERRTMTGMFLSANVAVCATVCNFALFPDASPIALIMMHIIVAKGYMVALTALLWRADQAEDGRSDCGIYEERPSYAPIPVEKENAEVNLLKTLGDLGFI